MASKTETHERLVPEEPVAGGSDRGFGFVMTGLFTVVGLFPLLDGAAPRPWALAVAGAVLGLALVKAELLAPLHKVWFKLGLLLHRIVSPVVLALLFYGVVTPTGLILRALGKGPLRLRFDRGAASYWIPRDPPGPDAESMKNQF